MTRGTHEKNIVGRRVAAARGLHKPPLTQNALSVQLALNGIELDRAAIAKIERNHRSVLDYELKGLAQTLGVAVSWLLGMGE